MKHTGQIAREFSIIASADDSIDNWWKDLGNQQQLDYIAKHPKTHFKVTAPKEAPTKRLEEKIDEKQQELGSKPEISIEDLTDDAKDMVNSFMSTVDEDFVLESQNYIEDMVEQKVIDGSVGLQHSNPKNVKAVSDYFSQLNGAIKSSGPMPKAPDNEIQRDMIKNSLMYLHVLLGETMKAQNKEEAPDWGGDNEPSFEQEQQKISDDAVKSYIRELILNVL